MRVGKRINLAHDFHRNNTTVRKRILHADQHGMRLMNIVRADGCFDACRNRQTVFIRDLTHICAGKHCCSANLVHHDVAFRTGDHFVAAPGIAHQGKLVSHRAGSNEQRSFKAKDLRRTRLQPVCGRVVLINIIPHLCACHCGTHLHRRLCHGIASHINPVHCVSPSAVRFSYN